MQFTGEDFDMYYRTLYTSNRGEDPSVIIHGTVVQMFKDFSECNILIVLLCFIPDVLFTYLPLLIRRLIKNSEKPKFIPEKEFKIDNSSDSSLTNLKHREYYHSLKDTYIFNKEEKVTKAEAIGSLRKILYLNNLILNGYKIDDSITFGKDIDRLLAQVLPSFIKLDDVDLIKDKLKEIYQEEVKVTIYE